MEYPTQVLLKLEVVRQIIYMRGIAHILFLSSSCRLPINSPTPHPCAHPNFVRIVMPLRRAAVT